MNLHGELRKTFLCKTFFSCSLSSNGFEYFVQYTVLWVSMTGTTNFCSCIVESKSLCLYKENFPMIGISRVYWNINKHILIQTAKTK